MRVLIPLPDNDFDVTEVAVPWEILTGAGHAVTFATERGGTAPAADPRLISGVIFGRLGATEDAITSYLRMINSDAFREPISWASIMPSGFDGLVLPGGHAPRMRQYLGSLELQAKVGEFWALRRPVGAICHGVLVLTRTIDPATGKSVLADRRTTCLLKYQERTAFLLTSWRLGRYYRTYSAYVEDEVSAALDDPAQLEHGPRALTARGTATDDSAAFVVEDRSYVSARWPGDAYLFAKRFTAMLERQAAGGKR
jgi:putative intracellular protease/amidase